MNLLEIIHGKLVISEMKARDKWEAIEEMVDYLVAEHEIRIRDRMPVLKAIIDREKTISTGMTDNVAIPHGNTDEVDDIIGVLGISHNGIPFQSIDGKKTKLICLLIYPAGTFTRHVRTIAGIARLMSEASFRQQLLEADSVEKITKVIEDTEGRILKKQVDA